MLLQERLAPAGYIKIPTVSQEKGFLFIYFIFLFIIYLFFLFLSGHYRLLERIRVAPQA